MKRRQFLLLSVGLGGLGLAPLVHKALTYSPSKAPISPQIATATPKTSTNQKIAPKGLYAPVRGDVRIVVISDLNSQYGSTEYEEEVDKAIALIPEWKPDLVLCGGDMVAAQKRSLSKAQIEAMWEGFDRHIGVPLRKANLPLGFTIGNHDGSGALSQGKMLFENDRDLASAYWNDPNHNPGLQFVDRAGFPFYYSFSQNDIFYLVWDASTNQIPKEQLNWVEKSLQSSSAKQAKMRIAIGHLPLYGIAVGREKPGEFLDQGDQLRSLLEKYHVHTYISGHQHAYFPGKKGELELLHTGALGAGPRRLLNSSLPPRKTLTVVDINFNSESTIYTTYNMTTSEVVDIKTLPRIINNANNWILRRDVKWEDLSPNERVL
jgi:hypothetical protein